MRRQLLVAAIVAHSSLIGSVSTLEAQPSAAISLQIDPSVRSVGMGSASSSVFWGDEPNYWANPALLGYHSGLHYQWSKEQLLPSLADDLFFETSRFTFGQWGIGLAFSGKPFHVDYGSANGIEQIDSYGFGVNVVELGESVMGLIMPVDAGVGRYFDFSVGWMHKKVDVFYGNLPVPPPVAARGTAEPRDFGIQSRLTPLDTIDRPMPQYVRDHMAPLAQFLDAVGGMRIDFTMARSWLNYNDVSVSYDSVLTPDPIFQDNRRGIGFHIAAGVPHDKFTVLQGGSWLAALFTPVLRFGMTWDRSAVAATNGELLTHYSGWEATILNVFSVRGGRTDAPQVGIVDEHSGWGLGLRMGDICGVRWDEARRPQALPENTKLRGFSAFVDFVALSEWGLDR